MKSKKRAKTGKIAKTNLNRKTPNKKTIFKTKNKKINTSRNNKAKNKTFVDSYKTGLISENKLETYDKLFQEKLSSKYKKYKENKEHNLQTKKFIRILLILITIILVALLLLTFST